MTTNGIAYPTPGTQLGLALEVTRGTPVAPEYWVPVKAPKYKPDLMLIPDMTLQGSMVETYDLIRGIRYDGDGWDAPPYLDSFPMLVCAELGSPDTKTAAPSATTVSVAAAVGDTTLNVTAAGTITTGTYIVVGSASNGTLETHRVLSKATNDLTLVSPMIYAQPTGATVTPLTNHAFSLLNNSVSTGNQPPSVTVTDFDGEEWRQITATQLSELNIKGNGTSLVEYTCTWFGNPAITPSTPSPDFTGIQTPAPWTFYLEIGGTYAPTVMDWEFNFTRNVKPIPALTGTEQYFAYYAGPLTAKGKFSFIEQSGSPQLNNFLNAIRQSVDATVFDERAGAALNIHSTEMQYSTGEIDRSQEYVTVPVEFDLLPSSTDALAGGVSPVIITIANSVTTAYL